MAEIRSWFDRPLAAFFAIAALVIVSVYVLLNSGSGKEGGEEINFRVTFRHYGNDAEKMEAAAAIPMEDALSAVPGISRLMTISENGQARIYAGFRRNRGDFFSGENDYYEAVREAAQRVYESLPSSAQRPELSSSGDSVVPFFTAAVYSSEKLTANKAARDDGFPLERIVKPALRGIEGVGDVEIAGMGIGEIIIGVDREKAAALGLSPLRISSALAADDALFSGGFLRYGGLEIPVRVDGKYADPRALGDALIPLNSASGEPGSFVRLADIARIREEERQPDILSRLNGNKTAIISVTAASGADTGILSGRIKKELEKFSDLSLEFHILEDRGAGELAAFKSVLAAALEASFMVAVAAILLGRGKSSTLKNGIICAAAVPLILLISAAVLVMAGFPVNRKFLAGLAVGIGGAVDAVILGAEGFGRLRESSGCKPIIKKIWPPLVAGSATTVVALLPLLGMDAVDDVVVIAAALGIVTLVSVVLALVLFPPFFLWKKRGRKNQTAKNPRQEKSRRLPLSHNFVIRIRRKFVRSLAFLAGFCVRRPLAIPAVALFLSASALVALLRAGTNTAVEAPADSVYARIEFEGGFMKEEGDRLLALWALELRGHPAIKNVQTGARTGSGYGFVGFDPGKAEVSEVRQLIRSTSIPGAFVYIPEASGNDRIWKVTVSGDDTGLCRELAGKAASVCSSLSEVKETVLNFKPGGPKLSLVPERELLAYGGIPFSAVADTVRREVYGPVIYKRSGDAGEIDVRLNFFSGNSSGYFTGDDVFRIPLAMIDGAESVRVDSVVKGIKTPDLTGIQRENRRRIASFSARTEPGDPRFFRDKIMEALKNLELPAGYKIEFDPEAVREAEAVSGKLFNFFWAIIFCYMIIAAAEESFVLPLIILSAIPFSAAVPVLFLVVSGASVNAAVACALVAVSGMTVNASVISAEELWRNKTTGPLSVYRSLKARVPVLLTTAGTSIAGALPFLFLGEGTNTFLKTLALVIVLGIGTSLLGSLTLIPSWVSLYFCLIKNTQREKFFQHRRKINTEGVTG